MSEQEEPWHTGDTFSLGALRRMRKWLQGHCHSWVFAEADQVRKRQHGYVRFDWVVLLLLYIREFPQFVPNLDSEKQMKNQAIFIGWVKLCVLVMIPKFRRRLLAQKGTESFICRKANVDILKIAHGRRLCADLLRSRPELSMLEHPRFSIEWLGFESEDDQAGYLPSQRRSASGTAQISSRQGGCLDRNDFRKKLACSAPLHAANCLASDPRRSLSVAGAIYGDRASPEDPFLNFDIENTNYEACIVSATLKVDIMLAWMTKGRQSRFHDAFSAALYENLNFSPHVEAHESQHFLSATDRRDAMTVSLVEIKAVPGISNLPETLEILYEVSCHNREEADAVAGILTDENVGAQLQKFQLPWARVSEVSISDVFDAHMLNMPESGPTSKEAQVFDTAFFLTAAVCCTHGNLNCAVVSWLRRVNPSTYGITRDFDGQAVQLSRQSPRPICFWLGALHGSCHRPQL